MADTTYQASTTRSQTAFGQKEVLDRKRLKPYTKRVNGPGLINFMGHMGLLGATGYLLYLALGTLWAIPAMVAHGTVMAFLFAPVHECSHGTAFRSRRLNETVFWIVSLIYLVPPTFFRYAHAAHHTYTQIRGSDPDIVMPRDAGVRHYLYYVSAIPFWTRNLGWYLQHALGRVAPTERYYLPDEEIPRVVREARLILVFYVAIAGAAIWMSSWAPLVYWIVPRLVGEPVMRWIRIAEHAGCEESGDLRRNTRTTKAPAWLHFLFWNMSYHAEHHLAPMVPFHALPGLHQEVKDKIFPVAEGYFSVHREVLRKALGRESVTPQDVVVRT